MPGKKAMKTNRDANLEIRVGRTLHPETIEARLQRQGIKDLSGCQSTDAFLDFSSCFDYDFGALLRSIILIHKFKYQDCRVLVRFPEINSKKGQLVWRWLKLVRFFETLSTCAYDPIDLLADHQIPYLRQIKRPDNYLGVNGHARHLFTEGLLEFNSFLFPMRLSFPSRNGYQEIQDYFKKWQSRAVALGIQNLMGWPDGMGISFAMRVVYESLLNSLVHSDGNILIAGLHVDNNALAFCLCDNGTGIPDTLRGALRNNRRLGSVAAKSDAQLIRLYTEPEILLNTDAKLIRFSTEKGITSDLRRKGVGLFYLKEFIIHNGGELSIRSGRGLVRFRKNDAEPKDNLMRTVGTFLEMKFPRSVNRAP